ncbi:MAG: tetratricopeptide repeat protein [Acidobacteria bacterium]|nr:tetratricopeptide repeat protein [Acidobacteriota bacterium]
MKLLTVVSRWAELLPGWSVAQGLQETRKAAERGDAKAQFSLGVMYDSGQGVPQDYAEALRWFRKAADQGHTSAQFNLGVMYANGQGVPENAAEGVRWYRKAADQGDALAQVELGRIYAEGQGVPQDYATAHMWLSLASAEFGEVFFAKERDVVAQKMTREQLAEAKRLAREWKPKPEVK